MVFLHGRLIICAPLLLYVKDERRIWLSMCFTFMGPTVTLPIICSFHYCDLGNAQISMWYWYLILTITMNMWWWPQNDQLLLLKRLITSGTSVIVFVFQMKEYHVIPIWITSNKTYCIISVSGIVETSHLWTASKMTHHENVIMVSKTFQQWSLSPSDGRTITAWKCVILYPSRMRNEVRTVSTFNILGFYMPVKDDKKWDDGNVRETMQSGFKPGSHGTLQPDCTFVF